MQGVPFPSICIRSLIPHKAAEMALPIQLKEPHKWPVISSRVPGRPGAACNGQEG